MIPKYLNNISSESLINLLNEGHVYVKLDNFNNIYLNSNLNTTESFISLPINNLVYNNDYLKLNENLKFTEFEDISEQELSNNSDSNKSIEEFQQELLNKDSEIISLQSELNSMISKISELNSTKNILDLVKPLVIELRIKLGEGKKTEDFSEEFPWQSKIINITEVSEQ